MNQFFSLSTYLQKNKQSDPNKVLLLLTPLSQVCFKAEPGDTACYVTADDVKKIIN